MKPVKVADSIYNITPGVSASFLVLGEQSALLIDTGVGDVNLPQVIPTLTNLPVAVAITHRHGDHLGGLKYFSRFYIHPKEIDALEDENARENAAPVREGHIFDLGGRKLEVLELPGHTPGGIGLLDRRGGLVFAGDMVSSEWIYMVDGQCDFQDFIRSMDRLTALSTGAGGNLAEIYCCHGKTVVPVGHAAEQKQGALDYLAGKLRGEKPKNVPVDGLLYQTAFGFAFFRPGA